MFYTTYTTRFLWIEERGLQIDYNR